MTIWDAIILGVVEGVSEFLPISSTGHMILAGRLLQIPPTEFLKSFEIAIQLGAMLSVVVLYGRSLLVNVKVMQRVAAAFIPTAVLGFALYKVIKKFLLGNSDVVLWSMLVGGVILIAFESWHREKADSREDLAAMPFRTAVLIGVFQSLAMIPGVSRSAATIVGGLLLGLKRRTIVEFSFLLAVPTMLAATALDLFKSAPAFSSSEGVLLAVGFLTSFVVALASIKFLIRFIQTHTFIGFGVYRIATALLFWTIVGRN